MIYMRKKDKIFIEKKEKLYYPVQDVQEQLFPDISKDSIIRLIERGEIPAKRITNKYFVPAWWWNEQIEFATQPPKGGVTNGK